MVWYTRETDVASATGAANKDSPMQPKAIYTISDLASESGVPARTIRYWIEKKLVPQSYATANPGDWQLPRYGPEHLKRIQKLQRWRESKPTWSDLAERLEAMGDRALDIPDVYTND